MPNPVVTQTALVKLNGSKKSSLGRDSGGEGRDIDIAR